MPESYLRAKMKSVFLARPKRSHQSRQGHRRSRMAKAVPHRLECSRSFMDRWCLHILPKGFTKTRWYGGYHGTNKAKYLKLCRQLLQIQAPDEQLHTEVNPEEEPSPSRSCPHCEGELVLIDHQQRPSWREVFNQRIYAQDAYCPLLHMVVSRGPP